ncbi:MAG: gfo/Idh/MocA family oxidoreductase [Paenibacillaceae bacterium]|jgi:predicted dehydrogenase|nr:gfo/Idh/MocA family oxidoreductase [Paenibacillaceae bacterium]
MMTHRERKEPVRIGLLGVGRAGWGMHCEELAGREEQFQIMAACDLIESRREKMKERYGCAVYERLEELLADPQVELVDIATRSNDHYAHCLLALAAGKHVFAEKPLTGTYEEALALQEAARTARGNLYVRHNRRFDPDFLHVAELIGSGMLGEVYEIKLRRHGYQRRDDWQTIKEFGGGQLLNWGPHVIDHALRLLDSPVADFWSDLQRVTAVGDSEDQVKMVLKGRNGRVVDLEISGGVALPSPVFAAYGTKGSLTLADNMIRLKILDPDVKLADKQADPGTPGETFGSTETLVWREESIPVQPSQPGNIWDELYGAIRGGREFPVRLEQAVEVMRYITEAKKNTPY